MSDIAGEILRTQERLAGDRGTLEKHWQEIAELVLPRQDDFFQEQNAKGEKRTQKIFDSTPQLALERFAAAMESVLVPRNAKWHRLEATDQRLNDNHNVRAWLDGATSMLFNMRYRTRSNYASQQFETFMSLGAFGTGVLIVEDVPGFGIRYKSSHVSEHFFNENSHGLIDVNYRRYKLTARQAVQRFPEGLPEQVVRDAELAPEREHEFIHCVMPNAEKRFGSKGPNGFDFASYHVSVTGKKLLGVGGFRKFPFIISRYVTSPYEIYGRSPAMTALAEIKMLNAMRKTDLRARHLAVDPPVLTADEQGIRRPKLQPGSINHGALTASGQPLVQPYNPGTRIDVSNDASDYSRKLINDTFLVTLFQILVESPAMTATEVLQRAQEKGALLAPTMGRQQSESLGPMIERELDILMMNGAFDDEGPLPMPVELKQARGDVEIVYTSPLARLQKAEDAVGAQRTLEAAIPLASVDPTIMDNFNFDEFLDIMADANGAPARMMRSDEELEAIRRARAEQAQLQQLIAAAPQISGSVKDIAQAQALQ